MNIISFVNINDCEIYIVCFVYNKVEYNVLLIEYCVYFKYILKL